MLVAPAITWLLVSTSPLAVSTIPVPAARLPSRPSTVSMLMIVGATAAVTALTSALAPGGTAPLPSVMPRSVWPLPPVVSVTDPPGSASVFTAVRTNAPPATTMSTTSNKLTRTITGEVRRFGGGGGGGQAAYGVGQWYVSWA